MRYDTAAERKQVYEAAIELVSTRGTYLPDILVCVLLDKLCGNWYQENLLKVEICFPEFNAQRPEGLKNHKPWWDAEDRFSRIEALNNAIDLCNISIQQQKSASSSTPNS